MTDRIPPAPTHEDPTADPADLIDLVDFDLAALTALNNHHARETSLLSEEQLAGMIRMAFYARSFGPASTPAALLIAFDQRAPYQNPNFQFFRDRHQRFVYVDRLITAPHARRLGLARRLYDDLFLRATEAGHHVVSCEVNLDPPNPASKAFHAGMGFAEVGRARLENGKTVRYLEHALDGRL
jgi:predicted GNAT superfamily acetyltransferase